MGLTPLLTLGEADVQKATYNAAIAELSATDINVITGQQVRYIVVAVPDAYVATFNGASEADQLRIGDVCRRAFARSNTEQTYQQIFIEEYNKEFT